MDCSTELSQLQALGMCGGAASAPSNDFPLQPDASIGATAPAFEAPDAAEPQEDAAGGCASPVVVPIGGSLAGTTCGGPQSPDSNPCTESGHSIYYFSVDAPAGAAFIIDSTAPLSVQAFETCGSTSLNCSFNSMSFTLNANDSSLRLFAVERIDVPCGDFSITIEPQ